ncbi:DUF2750 domain-containing protein [Plesiomonas shigelloides]|uniref:DUF2750 domain-containing protein n=1 Tax=Plesiomonas shigelloides TaxID=703 RepID=UPI000D124A35|nr:DUF2750 domain-containing protein [Plesiomonas shigelloides]AVQ86903.1 DUF2750 domain-containing protein [Plesiomonas shigelloides]
MSQLGNDLQANLALFAAETQQTGVVWGLCQDEVDWLSMESTQFEDGEVMPFWSNEADARVHCDEEWADFVPTQIPLNLFMNEWLLTLTEDGVLLGLNWNADLEGDELEPEAVAKLFI